IDRLLVEPLKAARFFPASTMRWCDLGSGGGSPALPIKLARPEVSLTMVESRSRKVAFLREAVRRLGIERGEVLHDRVERVGDRRDFGGTFDLITVRAVRVDPVLFDASGRLLRAGGELLLLGSAGAASDLPEGFRWKWRESLDAAGSSELVVYERAS